MEFLSNLLWAAVSVGLLAGTYLAMRRGLLRVRTCSAFALVALICLVLLPVISVSDDLLEARQATLPASAQTWHMAAQDASAAIEILPVLFACVLLVHETVLKLQKMSRSKQHKSAYAAWITRSHSLRPPPAFAL